MRKLTVGSLFAGIGGFDLGLERAGFEIKWQEEIDEFCQAVLKKHWPTVPKFGDIRMVGRHNLEAVDLVCGGFPCQPFSVAGQRRGAEDDRYLWSEMLRVIKETRPSWVVGENVAGLVRMGLDTVLADVEALGYDARTFIVPACAVGAPHRRDRAWIVAHSGCELRSSWRNATLDREEAERCLSADVFERCCENVAHAESWRIARELALGPEARGLGGGSMWPIEPGMGRVAYGVPRRMDRLKGLGNAVLPQIPEIIGRAILKIAEEEKTDHHPLPA